MAYSSGITDERIFFVKRTTSTQSKYGLDGSGITYQAAGTYWANVTWKKGIKELREGALDAYDFVMVRMKWTDAIDRDCLLQRNGRWYQIESFNDSYKENTIQITARELANQSVTIISNS